jgi:hypothetical protein
MSPWIALCVAHRSRWEADVQTPRQIAKAWRDHPAERGRIERRIAVGGLQHLFRWEKGRLLARIMPEDRARITASGGGAYKSAADRRFGPFDCAVTTIAGWDAAPGPTLDGEPVTRAEAAIHRALARRAA